MRTVETEHRDLFTVEPRLWMRDRLREAVKRDRIYRAAGKLVRELRRTAARRMLETA